MFSDDFYSRFKVIQKVSSVLLFTLGFFSVLQEHGSAQPQPVALLDINNCKLMLILALVYDSSPMMRREKAAWIVLNSKNELEAVDWPNTPQEGTQYWNRSLPANIVALVHTHPDNLDPKPSKQDEIEAHRLNICVFTLARKGIWSVTPDRVTRQHASAGWTKRVKQKCGH